MKSNAILISFVLVTAPWLVLGHPFHQDPAYHDFADKESFLGIPNAANVLSNLPFAVVGLFGLCCLRGQNALWKTLWIGLILTAFGSGYYHLHPVNSTLAWDRLPMSITFAAVICIFLQDAFSQPSPPLAVWLACSVATVAYWAFTGDLRPYIILQFGGMLFLVGAWLFRRSTLPAWGWVLLGYVIAKILEAFDRSILVWTHGATGGHPWKHIAAAAGFIPLIFRRRRA